MTKRVVAIAYMHESNTFMIMKTGLSEFRSRYYFVGDEIPANLTGTETEIGGFIAGADELGWEPLYTVATSAQPSGPVTEKAHREITDDVISRLKDFTLFDGIFVALHGAMVTETSQDGETQFLRAVREVVGPDMPIAVTLDLHANIFDEMADQVNIIVSYRTYPHIDMNERGVEACHLLDQAMNGAITPKVVMARPPMLVGCDDGRTTNDGPMCRLLGSAEREMAAPGILNVAINAGFTDADVYAAGPSVQVTYDAGKIAQEAAGTVARRICDEIWEWRDSYDVPVSLDACMEELKRRTLTDRPIIVADFSDNPGSGAYCDCTAVITAMIESGLKNIAVGGLFDPKAAYELADAGEGAKVTMPIGGKADASVGGGPVTVTGAVNSVSDGNFTFEGPMFSGVPSSTGTSVWFQVGELAILITSERQQMLDKNIFRVVGIEPALKSIVVVKSMQHFRGAFAPIAEDVIVTDAGGLSTPDVTKRAYTNIRHPVFPLDQIDG